jgi:membrane dipeptidase
VCASPSEAGTDGSPSDGPGRIPALRDDPAGWARRLGVSREAIDLVAASDVIDLHVESFIWTRVFRYDLGRWHDRSLLGHRLWGQADVPRLAAAGVTGAVMSIATNPFRTRRGRRRTVLRNVVRLQADLLAAGVEVVADVSAYRRARAADRLACFLALQGGHAVEPADLDDRALAAVSRVTLVHLTRSRLGSPSAPGGRDGGLTAAGRELVVALRERRVLLDLAHASPRTFWDALDVHGSATPVAVTHTGVSAVRPSWRNLDVDQIRAVADRGGVVGVILHRGFLARPGRTANAADVVRHLDHLARAGGAEIGAIGTDVDGFILPPRDLRTVLELPRLVQAMLDAGWRPERVRAVLGTNALRVIGALRPGDDGATPRA